MLIKNLLFILQSDDYDMGRFLKYAYSHFKWWRLQQRQKLTWTKKSIAIYTLSIIFLLFVLLLSAILINFWAILILILELLLLPLIMSLSLLLLWPLDYFLKKQITAKARNIISNSKAIVIGITGSYGKTSTKEILAKILA